MKQRYRRASNGARRIDEKVGVFEEGANREIGCHTNPQEQTTASCTGTSSDHCANGQVDAEGPGQQYDIACVPPAIEEEGARREPRCRGKTAKPCGGEIPD